MPIATNGLGSPRLISGVTFPWVEFIGKMGWGGDLSFGQNLSSCTSVIIVSDDFLEQAYQQIVGWSARTPRTGVFGGTFYDLFRVDPMPHPRFPWLWAAEIVKTEGLKPVAQIRDKVTTTDPLTGLPIPRTTNPVLTRLTFARTKFYKLTVRFAVPTYDIGFQGVDEWTRYVTRRREPSAEFITRKGTSYTYTRGAPNAGTPFQGQIGVILNKVRLRWTWHRIPDDALNLLSVSNIEVAAGKVNRFPFAGYPAGTLLMEAPKYQEEDLGNIDPRTVYRTTQLTKNQGATPVPVPTAEVRGSFGRAGVRIAPRFWNVEFSMLYFNPPSGCTYQGHNLVPHPRNGLWYLAASTDPTVKGLSGSTTAGNLGITLSSPYSGGLSLSNMLVEPTGGFNPFPPDTLVNAVAHDPTTGNVTSIITNQNATATGGVSFNLHQLTYQNFDFPRCFNMNQVRFPDS